MNPATGPINIHRIKCLKLDQGSLLTWVFDALA